VNSGHKSVESLDERGCPLVEHIFGETRCREPSTKWVKNCELNYRHYTDSEYQNFINSKCLQYKLQVNFDLFLVGLNSTSFTIAELMQDIYSRLVTTVGNIQPHNIMLIDNQTIKCK
jgi:hypothetical protein